jgi:enamine deaminase RidA (YjgF/YER057c/UK114 family)
LFKPGNLALETRSRDFLFVAGRVGIDNDGSFPDDLEAEVAKVFRHLDRIQADAGASWHKLIPIRIFHLGMTIDEQAPLILEEKAKRMPGHQHAWTAAGVTHLMPAPSQVEIDLVVYVGD